MPLDPLDRARAAYLWRLQRAHPSFPDQLVDVRRLFAALLGQPSCSPASLLDQARVLYQSHLIELPGQDERMRELAHVVAPLLLAERARWVADPPFPPNEEHDHPSSTYWVSWQLGPLEAASARHAAAQALQIQRDPDSLATVFTVQLITETSAGDRPARCPPPAIRVDLMEGAPDHVLAGGPSSGALRDDRGRSR